MELIKRKFDIPNWPIYGDDELKFAEDCITSGFWSGSRAKYRKEVSKNFLKLQNAQYGFPLASGTATLEAALKGIGIRKGDEVIVPALTFYSSASSILRLNATPVIVDVDEETFCISIEAVEKAITNKTKAIIPVHLSGSMCDMIEIKRISEKHNISIIEDCAHAHGSHWENKGAGTFGDFGCFSFQHSKLITSGEGGFIIAKDEKLEDKSWNFSNCGRKERGSAYRHTTIGTNSMMSDFQAAILNAQVKRYPDQLKLREENANYLRNKLSSIPGIITQKYDSRMTQRAYYNFIILLDPLIHKKISSNEILNLFNSVGIPTSLPYPPLNELDVFHDDVELSHHDTILNETPNAKFISENSVWLHHKILLADKKTLDMLVDLLSDALSEK